MYSATLGLVDIVRGTNSYYKLQLLEDDVQKRSVLLQKIMSLLFFLSFFFAVLSLIKSTFRLTSLSLTLPLFHVCAGTGCSGHGAEWVPPSEATSWTSFMTRTLPWTTSWVSTKRRRATTGAPPTSPNIPISSTPWRLTMDRYTQTHTTLEKRHPTVCFLYLTGFRFSLLCGGGVS